MSEAYPYYLDLQTGLYHKANCASVRDTPAFALRGLNRPPRDSRYAACSFCCAACARKAVKRLAAEKPRGKSKSEIIGAQLTNIARQYGMHVKIDSGLACVTTAAGEWFFRYNDRPIVLRHRNALGSDGYHRQEQVFYSPVEALSYIYFHERAAIRRGFEK